jgi:hypothetical protein
MGTPNRDTNKLRKKKKIESSSLHMHLDDSIFSLHTFSSMHDILYPKIRADQAVPDPTLQQFHQLAAQVNQDDRERRMRT